MNYTHKFLYQKLMSKFIMLETNKQLLLLAKVMTENNITFKKYKKNVKVFKIKRLLFLSEKKETDYTV